MYYESIRKRTDDVSKIAVNTGFDIVDIAAVKEFIFLEKHDLGREKPEFFFPNFSMAVSWQRLIEVKDIQPHDITMLNHEIMELGLIKAGYTQDEAHKITSKKYNYKKECEQYYAEIKKHNPQ